MKKLALLLCLAMSVQFAHAQTKTKYQDISITTSSFNNFGLMYRVGKENSLWRFQTVFIDAEYTESKSEDSFNDSRSEQTQLNTMVNFGLSVGKEWRKPLSDRFNLRWGVDIYGTYYYSKNDTYYPNQDSLQYSQKIKQNSFSLGPRAVFGFDYSISESFLVGVNISPILYYTWSNSHSIIEYEDFPEQDITFDYNMNGVNWSFRNSLLLSLTYQF